MTLRRALYASPLAMLVAVFAHTVAFGFGHAPGAERSSELLEVLGAALVLGLSGAFASGLLGIRARRETDASAWYAPLFLAAGGTLGFGCIEFSEGHLILGTVLEVALVSIPIAYAVAVLARKTGSVARAAGAVYGDVIGRPFAGAARSIAHALRDVYTCAVASLVARGASHGRAPPALI